MIRKILTSLGLVLFINAVVFGQVSDTIRYTITLDQLAQKSFHVKMNLTCGQQDTVTLVIPVWTPGYYQRMDYASAVSGFNAVNSEGTRLKFSQTENVWTLTGVKNQSINVSYVIQTERKFVATNYVDETHAYITGAGTFLYPEGQLNRPVTVSLAYDKPWQVWTGLEMANESFTAPDYDILYDCPILVGEIDELPAFDVNGVKHRFAGIQLGTFDRAELMGQLEQMVKSAVTLMGDMPFDEYKFIAIGPGRGGIEHLNNTTVSFDGNALNTSVARSRMLNFLTHEYFHHYNVKRIRPFELGPFDYKNGSRTNQLWISEGLTVYYEDLILNRAGIKNQAKVLEGFSNQINTLQKNPGRLYQSLKQASYDTWHDGPFGEVDKGKTISVYNKGAVIGVILDLAIRQASENKASLDDVMRALYNHYYKTLGRGFTESEFQVLCERLAGNDLAEVFEYIYTTKEIDYNQYLSYAGLQLISDGQEYKVEIMKNATKNQRDILAKWLVNMP